MKPLDLLVKLNTAILGIAVIGGIITSPFFISDLELSFASEKKVEHAAVVAGAFTEIPPSSTPTPTLTPTPTPRPVQEPVRIEIPALGIDTAVTNVGVTQDNVMEVPTDFSQVGWFDQSLKPGEEGDNAAIMSGHFDRSDGSPAVFYLLETLESGDEIITTAQDNVRYVFVVTDVFSHPLADFPVDIVYGKTNGSNLKIITCDGVWHANQKSYSDRLVVTTQLVRVEYPADNSEAP